MCFCPLFPSLGVKGVASQAEGRVAAGDQRDPQASLAPGQADFLAALTHSQAWFVSGEKPQAGVGCPSPAPWARLGSQERLTDA